MGLSSIGDLKFTQSPDYPGIMTDKNVQLGDLGTYTFPIVQSGYGYQGMLMVTNYDIGGPPNSKCTQNTHYIIFTGGVTTNSVLINEFQGMLPASFSFTIETDGTVILTNECGGMSQMYISFFGSIIN